MPAFNVWVRRLEGASRVRVDALANAHWLIRKLSDSFVFKTSEPVNERQDSPDCTFRVAHDSQLTGARFEKLLAGINEVRLLRETEPITSSTPVKP